MCKLNDRMKQMHCITNSLIQRNELQGYRMNFDLPLKDGELQVAMTLKTK